MATTVPATPPPSLGKKPATSATPSVSYEKFAPRSSAQVSRLSRIAALTAGPTAKAAATKEIQEERASDFLLRAMSPSPTVASTSSHSATADPLVSSTLEQTLQSTDHLTSMLKHTTSLRYALRASINIAEDISNRHAELIRHSGELSAAADRLQEEEAVLTHHAEEIGLPLKHYDAVDKIGILVGVLFKGKTTVRGLAKAKVDNEDFSDLLDEIDQAVVFFGRESGGAEALQEANKGDQLSGNVEYYRRALALQEAALDLIREAVLERISNTSDQVASALNIPKTPIAADKLEASLVYTRFHGISSRSNRLLTLVQQRLHQGDAYAELLHQCRSTYCTARETLLSTTVRAHMEKLKEQHGLVGMTRLASVFLIRLCTVETALYLDFFGRKKPEKEDSTTLASQVMSSEGSYYDTEFQNYLTNLCSSLHRTIRRGLVTMLDLDTLCQIVSILREERSMASSSPTTMAAARAITSVIADAQERLIFCSNTALTKEVIRFKATPADLDYPDRLKKKKEETAQEEEKLSEDDAMEKQLQKVYESWFPPMRSVLKILSKIFRVVEPHVFEDIALQSVQACTRCLKDGAAYIKRRKGQMHSDLFLVKHLLILREQLSPFDIELRSVERQLDFSDAGKAVARFLANRNRRLFAMNTENALLTLLREGVSVQESSVDSKRDLEDALRHACNDFIEHTCKSLASDIQQLVEKGKTNKDSITSKTVQTALAATSKGLDDVLDNVLEQMGLYLDNPATQGILLKPVSRKVLRALEETRKFIESGVNGDKGWDDTIKSAAMTELEAIEKKIKTASRTSK